MKTPRKTLVFMHCEQYKSKIRKIVINIDFKPMYFKKQYIAILNLLANLLLIFNYVIKKAN